MRFEIENQARVMRIMQAVRIRVALGVAAVALLAFAPACSSSRSSGSSSSSSRSSSSSSGSGGGEAVSASQLAFQEEIAAIAVLYASSNGSAEDFQRDVSAAAKRNGVPYWELDERVFTSIGTGLQRAGVPKEALGNLPFLSGVRNAEHFVAVGNAYP